MWKILHTPLNLYIVRFLANPTERTVMSLSTQVSVDGVVVGAAVRQTKGVRFIAIDWRAGELDQTVWPTTAEVQQAAEQIVRTGKIRNFTPGTLDG
jgi:hypothetical protein